MKKATIIAGMLGEVSAYLDAAKSSLFKGDIERAEELVDDIANVVTQKNVQESAIKGE
jgi:hypothetical protein